VVADLSLGPGIARLDPSGEDPRVIVRNSRKRQTLNSMANPTAKNESAGTRYALVTPVRDEEKYIGAMIESMLKQSVLPKRWIIVDDGSTDKTPEIVDSFARENSFLELIRLPAREHRAPGGESAITHALNLVNLSEYDFLARFDADLTFEPDYIARILGEFEADPTLGIAGGGLYIEKNGGMELEKVPPYHVRGALKMYRRECYEQIGGITTRIGWDTIDEVYAWAKGWKTGSFFSCRVIHRRPTGEGIRASRIYWQRGKAEYYTWSDPIFVLGKSVKLALELRSITKAVCYVGGFVSCYSAREPRLQDPIFTKTRRTQQMRRMSSMVGGGRQPEVNV
jgi:biofilm PGA synthesis N-glycosyltransferase PgaC